MCGCQPSFVCSRCAGDPKQDWRLLDEGDDQPREQREHDDAAKDGDGWPE